MAYTREQIGQALKAAHEAGDVEAARTLAVAYRDWKPSTPDPAMNRASQRANMAVQANEKIAPADLTQLGKLDFSSAAMSRLPPPTMRPEEIDAWEAEQNRKDEQLRIPDNDFKERLVIGSNIGTFGHGPQAMAGASTIGALLATPFVEGDIIDREGVSGAMSSFLNDARVHQRRGREERPIESYGGEIIGGLLQGKTIIDGVGKQLLPRTNTLSNVGRVMGTGAGYSGLYAFGQSEKDLQGALGDAAGGAAIGAGVGLGFKAAEPAITATYRGAKTGAASLSDALSAALGKAGGARDRVAEDVAIAAVRRSMERSGMTFDEIMEQVKRYEGKPAVLAEVIGQDAVNALTALTSRRGSTPQKAQAIIDERTFMRPERMIGDVEDATGIPIGQLDDTLQTQLAERQAAAKPLYEALYKRFSTIESFRQPGQTGQVMKRINRLARTPLAQRHLQLAKDAVATAAARRGIAVSKMSTMEYWDLVKRSLDNAIDSAQKRGEGSTRVGEDVSDLVGLKNDLVDELDRLTDGAYATVRQAGGEAPRLKAAAVAGQKALQARNPREVAKTVAATLSQDLPALRAGVVDDLGTRINKGTFLPNRVRVPDVAGKLRTTLGDESANKIIGRFDAEATLAETGSRWAPRVGPKTGTILENGPEGMADDLINAGFNLASGNKVGLFRQAVNFMRQRGFSQRQIDAIGDLLLSSPEEGLKRLRVMAPDGVPTGAAAPLAGGGGSGGLPPGGGGSPVPTPTPSTPIAAGGFAGFGGRRPPAERTIDTVARDIKDIEKQLRRKGYTLDEAETLAEAGTLPAELRGLMIQHADLVRESGRLQDAGSRAAGGALRNPQYQRLESELNKASDDIANAEYEIANELRQMGYRIEGDDGEFMGIIDTLKREGKLSNYLSSRVEDLRAASTRYFDTEAQMKAMARGTSASGLPGSRGPKKPTVGKPKRDIGTKVADASAVAALSLAPPAQAQGGGSAELDAAKQRVTDIQARAIPELEDQLRVLRDPKGDPFAKQEILKLRGYPLGKTGPRGDGVDGVIGEKTTGAIVDEAKKIERDIEQRRKDLEKAQAAVTQLEMRMAQQDAEVGPLTKTLREVAPWAGTIGGLAIAGLSRRGAVAKSRVAAQQSAARANALLNASTKVSRAQRGPDALSTRAANLNEFWRLGGAGENVPFKKTKDGKWTQRPKPMEPSRLFPAEKFPLRSMDAGVMAGGLIEAGGSQMVIMDNQKKASEARADIKKYAEDGDLAGVRRAQAQLEEAENMVALATAARNLGLGIAGGRGVAALKMPYAPIRPHINMAAAEDEQALLLSKMKK